MTDIKQKLQVMLELQAQMNARVHPHWAEQGFPWYRAIWTESAELMEHYGWKWWKKQVPDVDQVVLELIDIWHFGLSELIERGDDMAAIAAEVVRCLAEVEDNRTADFRADIEAFANSVLLNRRFDIVGFSRLMVGAGLTFDELYKSYIGKNVLNLFRQDNGYKEGTYRKEWQGREDNEHLVELARLLDCDSRSFKDDLYNALAQRYRAL